MACVLGNATSEFPLCMATDRWIFPANFAFFMRSLLRSSLSMYHGLEEISHSSPARAYISTSRPIYDESKHFCLGFW